MTKCSCDCHINFKSELHCSVCLIGVEIICMRLCSCGNIMCEYRYESGTNKIYLGCRNKLCSQKIGVKK